ncbi:MAG: Gfo/Idh/MocA family oxidoreductase [Planctomycetota bacterium]
MPLNENPQANAVPSESESAATTRRDFVKHSSVAALTGAAVVTGLNPALGVHVSGDDEIKVALIGCGSRGRGAALQALRTAGKVKLWAMADAFGSKVRSCLEGLQNDLLEDAGKGEVPVAERIDVPEERQFAGFDAYQQAIDSGVDLVVLTTPPAFRPIEIEAAVEAGKHVFMEKPLAVDGPGVRRVMAAGKKATEKGLAVGVGLQRHHDPKYIEAIDRIHNGDLGDVLLTRAYWNGGSIWVRTRSDFERAEGHAPTEMEYQVFNWYYFNWLSGDHIVEQHIHNLDVSNWVKNAAPVEANGMGGRQVRTGKGTGHIFDHHAVEYRYADGSTMLSQCRQQPGCWSQVAEYAAATNGSAALHRGQMQIGDKKWKYKGAPIDPYQQEHDDLFAAIRAGKPYNEAQYGAESTLTAIMGRMATYSGKLVSWEDALNSEVDLSPSVYDFAANPPVMPDASGAYPVPTPGKSRVV